MTTPPDSHSSMAGRGAAGSMQLATELLRQLPDHYLTSTTVDERRAHLELYSQFQTVLVGSGRRREDVYMDWKPQQKTVLLHLVFFDFTGSLNTVTATLATRSIDIVRVAAFGTRGGVALDTLEVSSFDEDAALLLKARFKKELDRLEAADVAEVTRSAASPGLDLCSWRQSMQAMLELPESYVQSTTLDERQIHAALFRAYEEQTRRQQARVNLQMSWACNAANTQVALHLLFPTLASLLGPTIALLQASSVSISAVASFSTSSKSFSILILHVAPNFNDQLAQKLRAHLANVLASAGNAIGQWDTSAALALLADMPDNYVAWTTERDRHAQLTTYELFLKGTEPVQLAWERVESSVHLSPRDTARQATSHTELHLVCKRVNGLLNVVTTTLGEMGVHILRVATFSARSNTILINTLELSNNFDEGIAQQIKQRVATLVEESGWFQQLSGMLPRLHDERMQFSGATPGAFSSLIAKDPTCSSSSMQAAFEA